MKVSFIAGFGPITSDPAASLAFWRDDLGLPMQEIAPEPPGEAPESCFGANIWPAEIPAPQAWLELDVESADAVGVAAGELEAARRRDLHPVDAFP